LSFIDVGEVLVFARAGRSNAEGAFATCHCLTLPPSEPGYYFWRDRSTHALTRRSEWFVTKSPAVTIGSRDIKYMISFALPRFCDQSLDRSRKEKFYPGADPLDREARHRDSRAVSHRSELAGIRRIEKEDGTYSANCRPAVLRTGRRHGPRVSGQQAVARRLRFPAARLRHAPRATAG
jgi:hypothetical protein